MLLHYLYEDLKLNKFHFATNGARLAKVLVKWILSSFAASKKFKHIYQSN